MRHASLFVVGWLVLFSMAEATDIADAVCVPNVVGEMEPAQHDDRIPRLDQVALRDTPSLRQFYVSGIIGNSYESIATDFFDRSVIGTRSVLTAGGAVGISCQRHSGALRFEIEGRGRAGKEKDFPTAGVLGDTDNWSTLVNAWRDFHINDRFGLYAGAGIGSGGFRRFWHEADSGDEYSQAVTTFAWQGGGGAIIHLSSRVTLDFGYRFYALEPSEQATFSIGDGSYLTFFPLTLSASEFLLSVRIYEPFRSFVRR